MKVHYEEISNMPPLSWVAIINTLSVIVKHGSAVYCNQDFFVEGAWSGEFIKGEFLNSDWFCGTGAQIKDKSIVFSTPSHVTYGLYSFKSKKGYYVISNSLYLIMALENLQYDTNYIYYETDFNSILDGINQYKNTIYLLDENKKKNEVRVDYYKIIIVNDDGTFVTVNKKIVSPFTNFDNYYNRMVKDVESMIVNSQNPLRKHKYGIVTTISKGYDAPCCAAIAKKVGCEVAITFKPEGKYKNDCGTDVAKTLGYDRVIEVDANEYLLRDDLVEAEYICSGELGAQISFSSFDDHVKGNVLFTGERGDSIWNKNAVNRNDVFSFDDMLSHLGSSERRLWLNYISVPLPLYGATSWTSIYNISNSEEMIPWQTNNNYDRPIPRRIVEMSGVKRNQFGIDKNGAGFVYKYDWMKRVLSRMSKAAASDFKQYVKENKKIRPIKTIKFFWILRGNYLGKIGINGKRLSPKQCGKIANPMSVSLLIPWSGKHMKNKYQEILRRSIDDEYFNS